MITASCPYDTPIDLYEDFHIVAECLDNLKLKNSAKHLRKSTDRQTLNFYIKVAEQRAIKEENDSVLNQLYFSGLIY